MWFPPTFGGRDEFCESSVIEMAVVCACDLSKNHVSSFCGW
jgi:hypothetical protein